MATDTLASPATLSHTQTKVFKNSIDGEWVESSTGETFENRNPADTRDLVGIFPSSDTRDVSDAVAAAKEAFQPRLFSEAFATNMAERRLGQRAVTLLNEDDLGKT